jgi:hypothetical protein
MCENLPFGLEGSLELVSCGGVMNILLKKLTVAGVFALLLVAWPQAATAIPLTFNSVAAGTVGPQSTSNPCVIAGTQCQQPASMGFNNYVPNNLASNDFYSTTPTASLGVGVVGTPYTVSQLTGALGTNGFDVAIDVNTASGLENLTLFDVIIGGAVTYEFSGSLNIGSVASNGNGFADWLSNTVSLANLPGSTTVLFHAVWNNATDGAESFFLIPTTVGPVTTTPGNITPEPTMLTLFGGGLILAARRFRRKNV